jgi:hypothetical protein
VNCVGHGPQDLPDRLKILPEHLTGPLIQGVNQEVEVQTGQMV